MTDRLTGNLRDYLEALRSMLDQEVGKGWPVLHGLSSLDSVLKADPLDLHRETDYLLDRLAEVRRARQADRAVGIPLPDAADVPPAVRETYEQGQQRDARALAGEDLDVEHDQDAGAERHRADPWKGAAALPPIGNATAFGFGLPSTEEGTGG